jgi:hypothetical protein
MQAGLHFCNVCEEHYVKKGMCKATLNINFQNISLTTHIHLSDDRKSILSHALQSSCKNVESEQDRANTTMIRSLHCIIQEDLPFAKYKQFVELMNSFNC